MAPPIKYFIIAFIVFDIFSYNGCLADFQACKKQINALFQGCYSCNHPDETVRVKAYLHFILDNILVSEIQSTAYALPFVGSIVTMIKTTRDNLGLPQTPETYCTTQYTGNQKECERVLGTVFRKDYINWDKTVLKAFRTLSNTYITQNYAYNTKTIYTYLTLMKGFIGVDNTKYIAGTTVDKFCSHIHPPHCHELAPGKKV